jgi:cytochrome c-type biogenesis protein CcmF
MGVGTLFGWKKTSPEALRRACIVPFSALGLSTVIHFALGSYLGAPAVVWADPIYAGPLGATLRAFNAFTPVMGVSLCVFNLAVIVQEYVLLFRARAKTGASRTTPAWLWWAGGVPGLVHTLVTLPPPSRRRYGGYIVHLGIVLMFIGFTGQSWNTDKETSLAPGKSFSVDSYTMTYTGPHMSVDTSAREIAAEVDVYRGGKLVGHLHPGKKIFKKMAESPVTEVAILHGLQDDVYVIVGTIDPQSKLATFQIHINPLVGWIWLGCLILIAGSVVCMWPQIELGESRVWAGARGTAAVAASVALGIMLGATPAARAQSMSHEGIVHIEGDEERSIFQNLRCMCGDCARDLLSTCPCSTAESERVAIRAKIRAGEKRDQILAEYAAEYGDIALAVPPNKGVLRAIWVIPVGGIALGAFGLARMMRRWRQDQGGSTGDGLPVGREAGAEPPKDPYDRRIDDELKDLDD